MRPAPEVHDALACLLTYPGEPGGAPSGMRYPAAVRVVAEACPEAADDLGGFLASAEEVTSGELEELYTRTFDNVADRSLEVGWQLFGENYARGALMVRFRALMREHGVPEHTELPDHLAHVLPLLGRLPENLARVLAGAQVMQAAEKIRDALEGYGSPWVGVLDATRKVLAMHGPEAAMSAGQVSEAPR